MFNSSPDEEFLSTVLYSSGFSRGGSKGLHVDQMHSNGLIRKMMMEK